MPKTQEEIDKLRQRLNRVTQLARAELMRRGLSDAEIKELLEADPRETPGEDTRRP